MKVLALILSLTLLVLTHELGHFLFARLFKTRVRRFYIFFNWGFSILKAKKFNGKWHFLFFNSKTPDEWEEENMCEEDKDNTLWGIGWIPLGGYCDIAGMIDETKGKDDLPSEPQPWEYRMKKPWQRLCIISGGVLVNFISALLIYTFIFAHWGKDDLPMRNASLGYEYHELLHDEGFQDGDIIYSIDGEEMKDIAQTQHRLLLDHPKSVTVMRHIYVNDTVVSGDTVSDSSPLQMTVTQRDTMVLVEIQMKNDLLKTINPRDTSLLFSIRAPFVIKDFIGGSHARKAGLQIGDSLVSIDGQPRVSYSEITAELMEKKGQTVVLGFYRDGEFSTLPVEVDGKGKIGVQLKDPMELFTTIHTEYNFFAAIPVGVSYGWNTLVTYVKSLRMLFTKDGLSGLGGFGTLGGLFPKEWDWFRFWQTTAFLAVILAFMNIIPIPGLDGGHIMFTLWEMITRRKPGEKFLTIVQNIGLILLLALLVIANGNDLLRLFR